MSFQSMFIVLAAIALSACGSMGDSAATGISQAQCRAARAQAFLGKTADDHVVSDAIVAAGAMRSRILRPGASATTDRDPLRLNIEVDAENRIRRMVCG
jgi:hypothetical protein